MIASDIMQTSFHALSPHDTIATVGIPKSIGDIVEIRANGDTFWAKGQISRDIQGIVDAGEDARYIRFKVSPGTWTISARTN